MIALLLAFFGFLQLFGREQAWEELTSVFLLAASLTLVGALLLPSAVYSLLRLLGKPAAPPAWLNRLWHPALLIFLLPLVILLGDQVARAPGLAWLGLPPLHLLAIGLPVLFLVYLGRRGLPQESLQRTWGIFGSGLVLGPGIILILEMAALSLAVFGVIIYLASQPELADELMVLAENMAEYAEDPEEIIRILEPYLVQPGFIYLGFAFAAGIVPLIEETLKPIGVWLYAGRIITPAQGFVAGLLSGAGFALFESLVMTTVGGIWSSAVVLRIGTGILHIVATGLVGWALALAWRDGRYLRLGLIFLAAVGLHSVWNAMAILSGAVVLTTLEPEMVQQLTIIVTAGLSVLALTMFLVLLGLNRSLRRSL